MNGSHSTQRLWGHAEGSRRAGAERTPASRRPAGTGARPPESIVVGSGFGGSVCAARLAERGLRVLLLERGPWWGETGQAPAGARRPYPRGPVGLAAAARGVRWARGRRSGCLRLRRDGLLELHVFDRLIAVTASGVGGGSLVYADIQMQPDDVFFDSFPAEITPDEMRPYYERVRDMLQPTPLPERPGRTALFEDAAAVAGLASAGPPDLAVGWPPTDAVGPDRRASSYLLGCEYPGKRSLDRTYVPLALRAGAEVRPLSEVVALRRSDRGYRVHWIDHGAHRRFWVDAPIVVLAAGTLGTLRLLFAARENGAVELPPALGRNFSVGGDVMAFLYDAPGATDSGYGPCPGAAVLVEQHGQHRLLIGEMGVPADALPLPERVRRALRSSAVLAGMGRDASTGTIGFDGRELRTATDRAMDPALFDQLESAMAAIGHGYRARWMSPPGSPGGCWLVTVHPSGGAPIGTGPDDGVVDHTGQVFGNPGLHVADASLFPRTPGLPPAMTIAALAERQAALLGHPQPRHDARSRSGPPGLARTGTGWFTGRRRAEAQTIAEPRLPARVRRNREGERRDSDMASRKSRTRAAPALSVPRTAAAGLTATVGMDLAALATARTLRMPPLGPNNLGRWVGHMREGRFAHDHIETAEPVPREAVVGAAAHYLIGPALGVGYGLTLRLTGRPGSSMRRGIAYGVVTTVFPWFLVYPAFGWGPMGLRGRGPKLAVSALVNHVAYGAGLGLVMTRLPPRPTGGAR